MVQNSFNFSAGPSVLPSEVKLRAIEELAKNGADGFSVMEISHRSSRFDEILNSAETGLRRLLEVPSNYRILFLSGGASMQFSMIPYNYLTANDSADYIVTGYWSEKAAHEAERCGSVKRIFNGSSDGFKAIPKSSEVFANKESKYLHYCSNETIHGVEFNYVPDVEIPIICDASSNILSKPITVEKHSLIYAGAQKNIGPSGISVVIIKDDLIESSLPDRMSALDYKLFAEHGSMPNTPNTWGIFIIGLVCEWLESLGGVTAIEALNKQKADSIYEVIDSFPDFYQGHSETSSRSRMNVTFNLPNSLLEEEFLKSAEANGLHGLKGHRSVGGIRASLYNAFPLEGTEKLAEFMRAFRLKQT